MSWRCRLIKLGHWLYVNTRFGQWYFNKSLRQIAGSFPLGHSAPITIDFGIYHVRIVSYSKDNYGFIIWRENSKKCLIIDPGYFEPFHEIIQNEGFILDSVLITHKHFDHCGGISSIIKIFPNIKIYANRKEKIKNATVILDEPIYTFTVCEEEYLDSIFVTAYHTPGHTIGHTVYTIQTSMDKWDSDLSLLVFTGDAIFMGSIGAMFECSSNINLNSLNSLLTSLLNLNIPSNKIMIFPGHEYSIDSLHILLNNHCPESSSAKSKLNWCYNQRNWLLPTIPTTLFDELDYSPFLRIAIATKLTESNNEVIYLTRNDDLVALPLPKLKDLICEILLSEAFVKSYVKADYSNINEDLLREKLFEDLSNENKKSLISCEHCHEIYNLKSL